MADLSTWIERWAGHRPNHPAIEFEGSTATYTELASQIERVAATLVSRGVVPGDRVAYLGLNRPEALHLLFACARIGALYLPLNSRLTPSEHRWILGDADPSLLVFDHTFADHVTSIDLGIDRFVLGRDEWAGDEAPRVGGNQDAVLLVYTSGTTGHPKGAVQTQASLLTNAICATHAQDLTSADRILSVLPLFHVGGLSIQTLPALHAGASVLVHRAFDPDAVFDDIERWRPTTSVLVPAILDALSGHSRFATVDLSSLRGVMTGSSVVADATLKPWFGAGVPVGQIYGSTEAGPIAAYLRFEDGADRLGSCGKPATHVEMRIDGEGERGEILIRATSVLREYWNNPTETAAAFTDDWFRTGDIGHTDDDGWLYIDDRSKDVIISGGENVYPAELDGVLADCSELAEAAVVGRPDERWGEVPVVIAVRAEGSTITDADVLALFTDRLARFKHPKGVEWTDALPRNAMGKVRKNVLRERFTDRAET